MTFSVPCSTIFLTSDDDENDNDDEDGTKSINIHKL